MKKVASINATPCPFTLGGKYIDFSNKEASVKYYVAYMLNRTQSIFEYENLPDTIPARNLELLLQNNGFAVITEVDGKLYAFYGGLGGQYNVYYEPTICTIANPCLNFSASVELGKDAILMRNDSLLIGLVPMFSRYATMLAENDVTIRIADINARLISLITAPDDTTRKAAELYLHDIENGKLGVPLDNGFMDGIKALPYASTGATNNITQLIELQQYLKASWCNDIGLNANYNMKRESINSSEAQLNDDALLPLIDDMLRMREQGITEINKKYGTNIIVRKSSAWKNIEVDQNSDCKNTEVEQNGSWGWSV